jgi:hypothetical protein
MSTIFTNRSVSRQTRTCIRHNPWYRFGTRRLVSRSSLGRSVRSIFAPAFISHIDLSKPFGEEPSVEARDKSKFMIFYGKIQYRYVLCPEELHKTRFSGTQNQRR